ncbi:hypothetical protein HW575_14365 [Bacillus velezensis]|nr:hypothetical protein BUE72_17485 [Bacillus amyloliquefaciens]MCO6398283.1 hypothetical protein [Bacillus velezensis]MDH3075709.1 hypothetical protein [Bacillus velezensis]
MIFVESKTMRDAHVYRDEVLEKVKAIPELPNTLEVTLQMASHYYDVPIETIRTIVKRNRGEFNDYGELRMLKGKALKEFKALVHHEPDILTVPSLLLINRRGLLRLGMMLTESEVAKSVRNYLLNVEEVSEEVQKKWAVEREISKHERRQLTDAIQAFYIGTLKKGFEYSTFTNMIYKVVFDMSTNQLKEIYNFEKGDKLRDLFTTEDLRKVVRAERVAAALIHIGKDYPEIKEELEKNKHKFQ